VVAVGWDHDGSHDSGNVKGGPLRHEVLEEGALAKASLSVLANSILDGYTSGIMSGIGLITIVVRLHQEPSGLVQFVETVYTVRVSFDDGSFVILRATNNVVDWATNSRGFQSL